MKYSEKDIIDTLTIKDRKISDYLVVLGSGNRSDILYSVHQNILFFDIIEDHELFLQCVEYLKKRGQAYVSEKELKKL